MSYESGKLDPNHQGKRIFLRTTGITILIIGIVLLIIGMVDFFSVFGNPFGGGPKYFWVNFIALPLIFVGGSMTSAGYMGAVARYSAGEMAPVGKDTLNYIVEGTKDSVKTIARSIKEGTSDEDKGEILACLSCGKDNPLGSGFCNSCGSPLERKAACLECGFDNPSDARFCNSCGSKLGPQ